MRKRAIRAERNTFTGKTVADCPTRGACRRGLCICVTDEDLDPLRHHEVRRSYVPGERIALSGQPLPCIGTVESGIATISRTQDRGTRQIVRLLQPGDLLGRPWRRASRFDLEAVTRVEIRGFAPGAFDQFLSQSPELQARMMRIVQRDLDDARAWLGILGRRTARQKLAGFLVHLALRQNTPSSKRDTCVVDLTLSREQLADLLSLTFETVSRHLNGMTRDRILRPVTRRVFEVPDLQALVRLANQDTGGAGCRTRVSGP